jgi:hypothetical protein
MPLTCSENLAYQNVNSCQCRCIKTSAHFDSSSSFRVSASSDVRIKRPKLPTSAFSLLSQMYMRSIAYIAILVLAATRGKGFPRNVKFFFFERTVFLVKSCSDEDTTIRCNGAWEKTQTCMNEVGSARDCYCVHRLEYFAVANHNFDEFKSCCDKRAGGWREC